ncbi:hypothetical protein EAG_05407 [Camponotus floridanus]|uniref:Secreted protein n=1 Tax=Camponotus floridanus TaxID=104421 RepID=E2A5Y9_CAMFO|nr:hypothetical protein EAG_05407 [Camponotus floridanus]
MLKQRLLPDAMTLVRAAVLAAVLGQLVGPSTASRPTGAHPGHAYFEQPCCGRSHLRHHKEVGTWHDLLACLTSFQHSRPTPKKQLPSPRPVLLVRLAQPRRSQARPCYKVISRVILPGSLLLRLNVTRVPSGSKVISNATCCSVHRMRVASVGKSSMRGMDEHYGNTEPLQK